MQERRQASKLVLRNWQSSFFVARMLIISSLALVGSMMLFPTSRVNAQAVSPTARAGVMYAVVYDLTHGRSYSYASPGLFIAASSMKVPIMLTFLDMIERQGRGPTNRELGLLTTMIENSNNDAASILYGEVGSAAGVTNYLSRIGLGGLYAAPKAWGWSLISPWTMLNLLIRLDVGTILTAHDRNLAFSLMENVEADQRGGVGDTAPRGATVALKDGWVIAPDGLWAVNSSGIVITAQDTYIISVYTREEPSIDAGLATIRQICATVAAQLH